MNGSFKMIMLHATFRNSGNYYKRNRDCQCLGKFMPEQKVQDIENLKTKENGIAVVADAAMMHLQWL
jgi:hypothetical protein